MEWISDWTSLGSRQNECFLIFYFFLLFAVQIIVEEIGNLLQGNLISAGVISKIISKILLLMDDDPVSIEMKQLCKIEFQNVENIMKEIEFEKNYFLKQKTGNLFLDSQLISAIYWSVLIFSFYQQLSQ